MAETRVFGNRPETILRKSPKKTASASNHVLMGTLLVVEDQDGDWFKVETRGRGPGGWVFKDDIRDTPIFKAFYVDVGQGDGAIIESPEGVMMIDGGPTNAIYRFMLHRYKSIFKEGRKVHIKAMVISHPDADHFKGCTAVLNDDRFTVGTLFHNGIIRYKKGQPDFNLGKTATRTIDGKPVEVLTETFNDIEDIGELVDRDLADVSLIQFSFGKLMLAAWNAFADGRLDKAKRVTVRDKVLPGYSSTGEGKLHVKVLGPVPTKMSGRIEYVGFGKPALRGETKDHKLDSSHTRNGHSIVLKLFFGKHIFLFGGDLNIPAEKHLIAHHGTSDHPFESDVAKACHHGSSDFTTKWLKLVNPQVNVFSSGDNKSFDHPVADALGAAGQHSRGKIPLMFSTELARATSRNGIHFGLINARSNGEELVMAQLKEQHRGKADVWDSFSVPWKGKFKDS